ncbi:MAG: GCN5 family acetyltransferase [Proteobacteria bacterium SG_bin6]|nr:MAG: GCN5 family acetyltransferase [Proteobacteria bacterium SG_bin6]
MSNIELSDDKARLDVDRIHGWLAGSYWSPGIARERVERAIANSHCLGAYRRGAQIGFARLISDRATFAWLADVWVDEGARGQGLGRRLAGWFLDQTEYADLRRIGLTTRDAHGVYAALGFRPLMRADYYMERISPELARVYAGQ